MVRTESMRSNHRLRNAANSARIGLQRMQQPKQRLSRTPQCRDGRREPPSDDTARSLLPGDRNQGAECVRGNNTKPLVPRQHGYVLRSDYQGGLIIFGVTRLKLEHSGLRMK